ncbi:hypothetical protein ACLXBB_37265, partial [Pseudomonas aeruginosa]
VAARVREYAELGIDTFIFSGYPHLEESYRVAELGDGPTVAARVREYAELGIDTFIFSGYPHLEESYRVAEL